MEAWYIQWYTMLCQSLRYSKVTQLYTYIHSLMFSSIMVYPRRLDIVPCDYLNFDPCINLSQFPLVWNPGVILHYSFLLSLGISPDSSWDKKSVFPRESEKWKSLSHVWLFVTPWTVVHGLLQARILEWVAFPLSRGSSQIRDQTQVSRIASRFFTSWAIQRTNFTLLWQCHNFLFLC